MCSSVRQPPASHAGDVQNENGHLSHDGSSACNGGERLTETRRGKEPSLLDLLGF
jgi:hypothetical protein